MDNGPPGSDASSRVPCTSASCMVFVSLVSISGATAASSWAGVAVAKLKLLFAAFRSAAGLMLPKNFCVRSAYIKPSEPSTSKPPALPLISPNSRYVLVTNCVCAIPSCGKSATNGVGALKGLFGWPTGNRSGPVVTLVGFAFGPYATSVVVLRPFRNGQVLLLLEPTCSDSLRNIDGVA